MKRSKFSLFLCARKPQTDSKLGHSRYQNLVLTYIENISNNYLKTFILLFHSLYNHLLNGSVAFVLRS